MAVYGTNIDINVIGNAIDQLQKIRADYERIKQNPGKDIKVGVEDHASQKLNETEEKVRRLPSRHDTHLSVSGTEGILGSLNQLRERASSTFSSIRSDMHKTGESAHRLRDIIAGTAIGQGIFNGVSTALETMKNGILGAVKAGFEYNAEMDKMNATWTTLTGSAGKADKMAKSIVNLSNTLGQSVGVTDELAQQFYHVFDNQPETEKLTKSFLTMGDAIGLSGDRLTQVGMDFTHMLSASTLHLGELNQITDAFPMFGGALLDYERKVQHSSSLTMNELRKQISAGKISAKDAEAVMNELGDKYKKASDNLMGTLPGMLRQIKAEGQGLLGAMVDPLNKAVNPIMKQVSKWVGDDHTKKEFSKLGDAANTGVAAVMQAFANAFGNGSITQMLDNMVNGLTDTVTKFSDWLARNGTSIVKIFASIGSIAKSVGTGFVDALSDFLHLIPGVHSEGMKGIADAFSEIAKHKTALQIIGRIWATYFVTSKIMGAAKAMNELYKNMLAITTLSKVQSPTGSLLGDIGYLNSGRVKKVEDAAATTRLARYGNVEKQGVKIAPYLDETGFKASWSRFANSLPILGSSAGKHTGEAVSKGLLARLSGGLTGLQSLGKGIAGKIGAGINIGLSAIDLVRGLTPSFKGDRVKEIGKGIGGLIGAGIGYELGGTTGAALGSTIGQVIGGGISKGIIGILKVSYKIGYTLGELITGKISFHTLVSKFQQAWSGMMSWASKEWTKFKNWWNGESTPETHSSGHSKQPSKQVVESLGGNNYSKQDIANVKEMNKAITTYTGSLKKLKASIKENDPTKQLNGMNSRLEKSIKSWDKLASPVKKIGKSFDELKSFNKSMTKDDAFAKLSKDIPKLDKALKSNQIAKNIKKISTELKKDNLTKTLDKMNASLNRDSKYWNALAKPIKTTANSFNVMRKSLKDFEGKHNPLDRLESSVKSLTKTVRRYQFGKELSKQMNIADKSMGGKHSFVNGFVSRTKQVESELRRFRTSFNRDWKNSWTNMDVYPSRAMNSVRSTVSSRLSSIESRERGFTSSFLSGWRRWTSSVVSEMRSAFNKLPGIAEQAMSGIVSRLNRGISSINSVISDFGGDKKLSAVHYANGTGFSGAHPGGLAVINDGDTRHKQELVWQPSQGWKLFSGLNRMVTLEPGAQVLPSELSHHVLSAINVPHYADGTLSDEEEDKIAEQFIDNPVKASRDLVLKFTNWNSGAPIIPLFGRATAIGFSRGIANVLKDLLGIIKEPRNGDWTPVIKSAARLMHVHLSEGQIGKLLRQIQTESGGNEKITQQISDVNSAAGHPAQGLLQFIPSTFNTWAMPGHHNLLSGFDQIMAAINALNHGGEGGWGNVGNGHGWANGGHLLQPDYGWVAEDGDEYIINPNKPNAMQLATEAISDILNRNPNLGAVRPTLANSQYQPAISPVTQTNITDGNNNVMVNLVKQVVEKLDNINIHPRITVEDMAKPIDKYNAAKFSLRRR
ncbi:tape measure protein [Limosilactobacillus reuteri]|uniref:tape measure protein n=1 Tax=Limosilactobacillus reuteri TaxID=1598 RepID=UPI0021CEC17F|nr:tape measure protein [Limosilactobacillus reuteri]MCU4692488.1 tape measure protein [Limosilactobacillus reuteri]